MQSDKTQGEDPHKNRVRLTLLDLRQVEHLLRWLLCHAAKAVMRSELPRHVEYFTFLLASGSPENDLREGSPSCCKNHDDVEERLDFGGPIRVWRAADRLWGIEGVGEETCS